MKNIKQDRIENEQNNFHQILYKFVPYWPLILILFVLSVASLFLFLKTTSPVYETSASVLIRDENKGQQESQIEGALNTTGSKNIVENEMEVLRSNVTISEVVKVLKLYAPLFEEKGFKGMITASAYQSSPIAVEALVPDSIKPVKKVYFNVTNGYNTVTVNSIAYPINQWVNTPWGKLKFLPNPNFKNHLNQNDGESKFYFSLVDVNVMTSGIIESLLATPTNRLSSIINLNIKDPVPQRAESILHEIVNAYNKISVGRKNDAALRTLKFIDERLKHVSSELDSIGSGIQKYRDKTGTVDITEQSRIYLSSIETNDREVNNLNLQLSALDEVEKYVTAKNNEGNIVPSTYNIADPTLSQLLTKLSSAEIEYEKLKKTTAENNPVLQSIQDEINKVKPSVLENVRNQKKNILAGRSLLNQTSNRYSSLLNSVPKKERELVEVSRQQEIVNSTYAFLLQKREETASSISTRIPDCTFVGFPLSSSQPVSPKKSLLALMALILPFMLSFIYITLKDLLNTNILYRSDIEKLTNFPVIGELINEKGNSKLVTENKERSFIVEQFRQVRTALKYQGIPQGNHKRILVTSSIKGEGKSFVSSNLAISLARSGKKVALLEMDLHQPKLSETFDIPAGNGITDYLLGTVKPEEIIVPTSTNPNLFLIPAGNLADEPSELLVNGRLETLLNYLDGAFDVLVIDTVPVKALTDAYTIASSCNLIIYIVRHNYTPKMFIEQLDADMMANNNKSVAVIFNGVKTRGWGKKGYGLGYGYGYDSRSSYDAYAKKKKRNAA